MSLKYEDFIGQNGLKNTSQREVLFNTLMATDSHFSTDEILQKVQKKDAKIGYTTVYRMLKLMVDAGILHEHHFGDRAVYEVSHNKDHHEHLICTSCDDITEFSCEKIEKFQDKIAADHGFKMTSHKHELYGLCKKCQ